MRDWNLSHGQEGTSVTLREVPFWAWAAEYLGEEFCWLTEQVTGFCFIAPPEWMFKLRWGKLDGEGYTSKSVGSKLWHFGNAMCGGFGAWRRGRTVDNLPVSYDWVREHVPGAGWPWDGSEDDEKEDENASNTSTSAQEGPDQPASSA